MAGRSSPLARAAGCGLLAASFFVACAQDVILGRWPGDDGSSEPPTTDPPAGGAPSSEGGAGGGSGGSTGGRGPEPPGVILWASGHEDGDWAEWDLEAPEQGGVTLGRAAAASSRRIARDPGALRRVASSTRASRARGTRATGRGCIGGSRPSPPTMGRGSSSSRRTSRASGGRSSCSTRSAPPGNSRAPSTSGISASRSEAARSSSSSTITRP